jgi:tetratricopeptide (TPR) repeat protein
VQPTRGGRYQLHELLRQYAAEKLAEDPAAAEGVRDRHAAYYTAALAGWEMDLKGPRQREALLEMDLELDNIRSAWEWAVARAESEWLTRAAESLALYYVCRGLDREGKVAFRRAAERLQDLDGGRGDCFPAALEVLVKNVAFQSGLAQTMDRGQVDWNELQTGLDLLGRCRRAGKDARRAEMWLLFGVGQGQMRASRGDHRRSLERSLALARSVGDEWWAATVLDELGVSVRAGGDTQRARRLHEESREICRTLGDERGIARATMILAFDHMYSGDLTTAERLAQEGLSAWRALGDPGGMAGALETLAIVYVRAGRFAESQALMERRLAIFTELGLSPRCCLTVLGATRLFQGDYDRARQDLEAAVRMNKELGEEVAGGTAAVYLGQLALFKRAYGEARRLCGESIAVFSEIGALERTMWTHCWLAHAELGLGRVLEAEHYVVAAMEWIREYGPSYVLSDALPVAALVLADQGDSQRAIEIYELARTLPFVANNRWYEDVVSPSIRAAASELPSEVVIPARERGRMRDVQATLDELIAEWS